MMNLFKRFIMVFLVSVAYSSTAAQQPVESVQQVNALKLTFKPCIEVSAVGAWFAAKWAAAAPVLVPAAVAQLMVTAPAAYLAAHEDEHDK